MKDLEIRGAGIYWERNKVVLSMKWALKPYQKLMQEALEELQNEDDFQDLFENEEDRKNYSNLRKKSILTLILS